MRHANIAVFIPDLGCPHRCVFCNQKTISGAKHAATAREIDAAVQTAVRSGIDPQTAELAFFGGSFTCIDRARMCAYLSQAQRYLNAGVIGGIRVSTRPDGIDPERLSLLRQYGVTAIELGCQSMDDDVLRLAQRGHTAADTVRACRLVKDFGFALGVQMMTGLPGSSDVTDRRTAEQLIALAPDTARIYPTLVFAGTRLDDLYRAGTYRPQSLDEAVALCSELLLLFAQHGVRVIRLGLHADDGARACLAGPFHPALRELCESRIYLDRALQCLAGKAPGSYDLTVGARYLSQAVGHHKQNVRALGDRGFAVRFHPAADLNQYEVRAGMTL